MKKKLLLSLLFLASFGFSQSYKSKSISITIPSYPSKVSVENLKTYDIRFIDKAQRALPFNEKQLRAELQLEDKQLVEEGEPDMFFAVKGLGIDDIYATIQRNGSLEEYFVEVLPLNETKISVILMVKGELTQIVDFPITAKTNNGVKLPTTVRFPFKEAEKYLDFTDVDKAKPSPTLVKYYLKQHLGDYFLKDFVLKIKKDYDYGANVLGDTFYFIKDRKNKPLKDESKKKLLDLEEFLKDKKTLKALRNSKVELEDYKKYWSNLLETYKSEKKVAWAMLVNLNSLSMITENIEEGTNYLNQLVALKTKSWATSTIKSRFEEFKEKYDLNHNKNGERIYANSYEVDSELELIKNQEELNKKALANSVNGELGYVLLKDGDKLEGKVTLLFAEPKKEERKQVGTMINLDGPSLGKYVVIEYVNEKGKNKRKAFKFKKVNKVVVGDKVFKPINPQSDSIDTTLNIMSFSFNNTVFMKELYISEKLGLYQDLMTNQFYIKFEKDKKAKKLDPGLNDNFIPTMSELFKSCPTLVERIKKGELKNNDKDLLEVVKTYSENCK